MTLFLRNRTPIAIPNAPHPVSRTGWIFSLFHEAFERRIQNHKMQKSLDFEKKLRVGSRRIFHLDCSSRREHKRGRKTSSTLCFFLVKFPWNLFLLVLHIMMKWIVMTSMSTLFPWRDSDSCSKRKKKSITHTITHHSNLDQVCPRFLTWYACMPCCYWNFVPLTIPVFLSQCSEIPHQIWTDKLAKGQKFPFTTWRTKGRIFINGERKALKLVQ